MTSVKFTRTAQILRGNGMVTLRNWRGTHLPGVLGASGTVVRTLGGRVRGEDVGGGYWRPMAHPHPARRQPPELHDRDL